MVLQMKPSPQKMDTGLNRFKPVQTCSNLFKLDDTCSKVFNFVSKCWKWLGMTKNVQNGLNMSNNVQICANFFKGVHAGLKCSNMWKNVQTCAKCSKLLISELVVRKLVLISSNPTWLIIAPGRFRIPQNFFPWKSRWLRPTSVAFVASITQCLVRRRARSTLLI